MKNLLLRLSYFKNILLRNLKLFRKNGTNCSLVMQIVDSRPNQDTYSFIWSQYEQGTREHFY